VGHRSGATLLHRQTGLGAVERLDLALLIDRENDGMGGWIGIEADDIAQFVDKLRVGGELELFHPVRLKTVRTPDALDGTRAVSTTFAIMAEVQWVASAGGAVWVSVTTRSQGAVVADRIRRRRFQALFVQRL
jgi:hypothetical protein